LQFTVKCIPGNVCYIFQKRDLEWYDIAAMIFKVMPKHLQCRYFTDHISLPISHHLYLCLPFTVSETNVTCLWI